MLPGRFIFKDQYIELSTRLPRDANIYGIGEVSLPSGLQLPRDGTTITLWARDMPSANPYANLYGSHPFYLQLNAGGGDWCLLVCLGAISTCCTHQGLEGLLMQ
jgi:alpha-glucosidase (family GH31 glycosyl hydrolase)